MSVIFIHKICVAVKSLAGARTLCHPIVLVLSVWEPCLFSSSLSLFFFFFFKSCWSAIISPPQICPPNPAECPTHTYTRTSDYHPGRFKKIKNKKQKKIQQKTNVTTTGTCNFILSPFWGYNRTFYRYAYLNSYTEPKIQSESQAGEEWKWSVFFNHCTHFENIPNSYWFFKDK